MTALPNPAPKETRLDSWKTIAAFFGKDERTVKRWEKERGLPVHRLPGARGSVFAYTGELERWLAGSENDSGLRVEGSPARGELAAESAAAAESRSGPTKAATPPVLIPASVPSFWGGAGCGQCPPCWSGS